MSSTLTECVRVPEKACKSSGVSCNIESALAPRQQHYHLTSKPLRSPCVRGRVETTDSAKGMAGVLSLCRIVLAYRS